ncbi:hypothetical protein BCR43DRAFT_487710 [Syncephalastrum racemosum]|uniref:Uncharacterized protein n=1 Tax=Syncephalastrum racemosum TaxID=13706 RepID=A0A1X2HHN9_SYNRA|nr:hypothetical protein BCR43DRAFT_487710 [Syncephalastrum racemosum]
MNVAREIVGKLPSKPSGFTGGKNLYQLLSILPEQGVGVRVAPNKFINKPALKDSYYEVTKVKFKPGMTHGRAWGVQVLKGRTMQEGKPMEIRGGLKYRWRQLQ